MAGGGLGGRTRRWTARGAAIVAVAGLLLPSGALLGCEPTITVGEWVCTPNATAAPEPDVTAPVAVPWATGFEDRFCDYAAAGGFCYGDPAVYRTVTSPVHSGRHAAAFTVESGEPDLVQARCVRQGTLPESADYGAWYLVPSLARNTGVWNLLHFQGGDVATQHGLWDVSLVNGATGGLELVVFDFLNQVTRTPTPPAPIPIGAWFHLSFHLLRAADASGEIALYLDDRLLVRATGIVTDDSTFGQWYVGNYATGLDPASSTLYVDDVTISPPR